MRWQLTKIVYHTDLCVYLKLYKNRSESKNWTPVTKWFTRLTEQFVHWVGLTGSCVNNWLTEFRTAAFAFEQVLSNELFEGTDSQEWIRLPIMIASPWDNSSLQMGTLLICIQIKNGPMALNLSTWANLRQLLAPDDLPQTPSGKSYIEDICGCGLSVH